MLVLANIFSDLLSPLTAVEQFLLERMHDIGIGWGLAIVFLTLLVRVATVPLVVKMFRAQREMREHIPEMKRIQQRHKDDRQRQTEELQAYYRKHGVNPIASFLPVVVQLPIFFSLYYLMRHDAQSGLFGDDGFLFIPQLTEKPHGSVLMALIAMYLVSQIASSLIATRAIKGGSKWIMLGLPLLFVSIVPRFPAGLAVYWITTSLWTLGQQIVMWRLQPQMAPTSLSGAMSMETGGGLTMDDFKEESSNGSGSGNGNGNGSSASKPPPQKRKKKKAHGRRR